eukprot:COSAG02_NODE_6494_length_3538_cov_1.938936_5_plen_61_part_00
MNSALPKDPLGSFPGPIRTVEGEQREREDAGAAVTVPTEGCWLWECGPLLLLLLLSICSW